MATAGTVRRATLSEAQKYLIQAAKEGKASEVQRIGLNHITDDHKYQSRVKIDRNYIHSELRPLLEQFGDLEPIILFKEYEAPNRLFIGNGFHRYELYKMADRPDIPAIIIDAGLDWERELRLYSASANLKFSKPPTKEDKLKAICMLFADDECWTWSDQELARRSGLVNSSVSKNRWKYSVETGKPIPREVKVFGRNDSYRWRLYSGNSFITHIVRPKKGDNPRAFRTCIGGKDVTISAANQDEAEEKAAEIARSIQTEKAAKRHPVSMPGLQRWLCSHGMNLQYSSSLKYHVLRAPGLLIVPCLGHQSNEIARAVGSLVYAYKTSEFPQSDMVVACHLEDWINPSTQEIVRNFSAPGLFQIHFLTPEEIVERYSPRSDGSTAPTGQPKEGPTP